MRNKLLSSIAIAGLALSLVACSGGSNEAAGQDCAAAKAGASSAKVKVSGKKGAEPTVEFTSPLTAKTTERTVITEGDGDAVALDGSSVTLDIYGYNATTGKAITELTSKEATLVIDEQLIAGLVDAVKCSTAGARVAAVVPPADLFGEAGSEAIGLSGTDSLVLLIDVVDVAKPVKALAKADGAEQPAEDGFPAVKLDDTGAPTVSIPAGDPPAELKIANLKKGEGKEVADGDNVTVHYTGVIWATGEVFDSSWTRGEPASFVTTGVIPGFGKAIVGQKVGSQVIAVIPPAEGYGEAGSGELIGPTDTLVFVVDILATQ